MGRWGCPSLGGEEGFLRPLYVYSQGLWMGCEWAGIAGFRGSPR